MSTFLHSPADILAALLVAQSQGGDAEASPLPAWPVYVTDEPGAPDNVLTVFDTAPVLNGRRMADGVQVQHYGLQVRVRGAAPAAGWAKARSLAVFLAETVRLNRVTLEASQYLVSAVSQTSLLSLGKESPESKRVLYTVNCLAAMRALT